MEPWRLMAMLNVDKRSRLLRGQLHGLDALNLNVTVANVEALYTHVAEWRNDLAQTDRDERKEMTYSEVLFSLSLPLHLFLLSAHLNCMRSTGGCATSRSTTRGRSSTSPGRTSATRW
jgi:hypothetical protein